MPRGRWKLVDWESTEVAPTTLKSSPNFVNGTASEIDRPLTATKQYAA
jgi:hypothetical protein